MRLDTPVLLTQERPTSGAGAEPEIVTSENIYCAIEEVGSVTYWQSVNAGIRLDKTIILWKWDVKNYTHAEIEGIKYKISDRGKAKDKRQVKLHLKRG